MFQERFNSRIFIRWWTLQFDLPTVTITSTSGTGAVLTELTNDIGSAKSINVNNTGFDYSITNPPEIELRGTLFKRCYWYIHN